MYRCAGAPSAARTMWREVRSDRACRTCRRAEHRRQRVDGARGDPRFRSPCPRASSSRASRGKRRRAPNTNGKCAERARRASSSSARGLITTICDESFPARTLIRQANPRFCRFAGRMNSPSRDWSFCYRSIPATKADKADEAGLHVVRRRNDAFSRTSSNYS